MNVMVGGVFGTQKSNVTRHDHGGRLPGQGQGVAQAGVPSINGGLTAPHQAKRG